MPTSNASVTAGTFISEVNPNVRHQFPRVTRTLWRRGPSFGSPSRHACGTSAHRTPRSIATGMPTTVSVRTTTNRPARTTAESSSQNRAHTAR